MRKVGCAIGDRSPGGQPSLERKSTMAAKETPSPRRLWPGRACVVTFQLQVVGAGRWSVLCFELLVVGAVWRLGRFGGSSWVGRTSDEWAQSPPDTISWVVFLSVLLAGGGPARGAESWDGARRTTRELAERQRQGGGPGGGS